LRNLLFHTRYKKDFKRELRGRFGKVLEAELRPVIAMLLEDIPLPARLRDHALTGDWADYRDCHIKPDLVLIYRLLDNNILQLVRLGSHSELGI
jgi:mRNA interferase YafQ